MGFSRRVWSHFNKYLNLSGLNSQPILPSFGIINKSENYYGKKMLELGCQVFRLKTRVYNDPENKYSKSYFDSIGIKCTSIDITKCGKSIQIDLRKPINKKFHNKYDIVTNIGTTEHIDTREGQFQTFENIHLCIKKGGIMMHFVPIARKSQQNHSPFYYNHKFFKILAKLNNYKIITIEEFDRKNGDFYWGICLQKQNDDDFTTHKSGLIKHIKPPEKNISKLIYSEPLIKPIIKPIKKRKYDKVMSGKDWNGTFKNKVIKYHKISFCTTCMGRLERLKETLPKNIEDNKDYPNLEFIIIDYNSNDGLWDWMKDNMMRHIESGKVSYYRTTEPKYFDMSHSRNIAFKVATGNIVNNIDADNFTSKHDLQYKECWASYINRIAHEIPKKAIFVKSKQRMHGRIGFYKKEFIEILGGYDEKIKGYGHDDKDLVHRALKLNFTRCAWKIYFDRIYTHTPEKDVHLKIPWRETKIINEQISEKNINEGKLKANEGIHWGKANLIKNFKEHISI